MFVLEMSPTKKNVFERFVSLKIDTKIGSELLDCGKKTTVFRHFEK